VEESIKKYLTLDDHSNFVRPISEAGQVVLHVDTLFQLPLQDVTLIEEANERGLREKLRFDNSFPEDERVLETVDGRVFEKAFIEAGYWGEEYNCIDSFKVW
jgi:hypothetical protein